MAGDPRDEALIRAALDAAAGAGPRDVPIGAVVIGADGTIYVYDADGEKVRALKLEGTGPLLPNSLSLPSPSRLLVAPGLYEFTIR